MLQSLDFMSLATVLHLTLQGQDKANPIATILSAAMMLRYSFDLEKEAGCVEAAVKKVLKDGYRTVILWMKERHR